MGCEGSKTTKASAPEAPKLATKPAAHGHDALSPTTGPPALRKGQSPSGESLDSPNSTAAPTSESVQGASGPCSVSSGEEQDPMTIPQEFHQDVAGSSTTNLVKVFTAETKPAHQGNALEAKAKDAVEKVPALDKIRVYAAAPTVVVQGDEGVAFEDFDSCEVIDTCLQNSVRLCCVTEVRRLRLA